MVMQVPTLADELVLFRSWSPGAATNYTPTIDSGPYRSARVEFDVESEAGTSTTDVELQYYSAANNEWTDWLDGAGTVMKLNNYADGETGRRWIEIGIGNTGGADVDKVLVVGNNAYYDMHLMPQWRLKVVTAGTPIISASVYFRP